MKSVKPLPESYFSNYADSDADGDSNANYDSVWRDYGFSRFTDYLKILSKSYSPNPESVLETGSASGKVIKELTARGMRCRGIENSKHILRNCDPDIRKLICKGNAFEVLRCMPTNSFDCVYETCAEYLPEDLLPEYFFNVHRVTKHDLVILLHSKEEDSEPHTGQVTHLSNAEWFELLENAGFVTGHEADKANPVPFYFKKV